MWPPFWLCWELCRTSSVWLTDDGTGDNPELKPIKTPEEAMRKRRL
ncbi:MAG: hypothetical protein ACLSHU_06860 [Oscillospiraceae bacterium]